MGDEKSGTFLSKLKAAKEVIGAVVVIGGVLVGISSFMFDEAMEERDRAFEEVKGSFEDHCDRQQAVIESLKERLGKLESAHNETLNAARERFQQNEIVDTEIQGSVTALRGEVRIRHREDPDGYGVSRGTIRLRTAGGETDRMLTRARNAQPQSAPLEGL